jgi:hypothetical protein
LQKVAVVRKLGLEGRVHERQSPGTARTTSCSPACASCRALCRPSPRLLHLLCQRDVALRAHKHLHHEGENGGVGACARALLEQHWGTSLKRPACTARSTRCLKRTQGGKETETCNWLSDPIGPQGSVPNALERGQPPPHDPQAHRECTYNSTNTQTARAWTSTRSTVRRRCHARRNRDDTLGLVVSVTPAHRSSHLGRKPQRHLGMSRGDGRGASNRTC